MKKWKIPMTWEMYGVIEIEAINLEEAKKKAISWDTDLPKGICMDDSVNIDSERVSILNKEDEQKKES